MTNEAYLQGESQKILSLLDNFDFFHVRKPKASSEELIAFMNEIPESYHGRLVNHGHMSLWSQYGWRSAHFSHKNPPPAKWNEDYSYSCHNFIEIESFSSCEYLFLSPVFDSISKIGYKSKFPDKDALEKKLRHIKSQKFKAKIIALGGVTLKEEERLLNMGFDGVCIKGELDFIYEK